MLTIPKGCTSPRPLTSPHHQPSLHLISPSFTHRSQTRHLWPSHTCCMYTLKVHRTHTCICAPHTTAQTTCSSPHLSPFPRQSTNTYAVPLHWKKGTKFFEHLLCATQHTEPFICAFFLKLFTSPWKFVLQIVNMRPREMTPSHNGWVAGLEWCLWIPCLLPCVIPTFLVKRNNQRGRNFQLLV